MTTGSRVVLFAAIAAITLNAGAQAQNFFQIRGLFPPEDGRFTSAPALDAALNLPLGPDAAFGLKLEALTVVRQRGQVSLRVGPAFAGLIGRFEPSEEQGARSLELDALGQYDAPSAEGLSVLGRASLAYSLDADSGPLSGYQLHQGQASLDGDLAERWTWSADYTLNSDLNPVRSTVRHALEAWVRTTLLDPVTLGAGVGLRSREGNTVLTGSLEAALKLTEQDTLGARVTLTTAPGDEERVFYSTSRLEPLNLTVTLGRSSESVLIWALNAAASSEDGLSLNGAYEGRAGTLASHEATLGVGYGGQNGSVRLRAGLNLERDNTQNLWFGRLLGQVTASLEAAPWSLHATGRVDVGPDRAVGRFTGNASFFSFPWLVTLEADLKLRGVLTGAVTLQGWYYLFSDLAVNATAAYRFVPVGQGGGGFSVGLGLRYQF